MKAFCVLLIPLTACATSASFSTSSPRASGADTTGHVTIPNVFKLRKEQAIAELRRAGVQGDIRDDSSLCGSLVEGKIIEIGEVCYQHPAPGQVQGARLGITLRVQDQDPRHGNVGKLNEWRLMPNVVGKTYEQAIAELKRAGFEREDRVKHVWADEQSCRPLVVCRQYPEPLDRAGLNDGKVVYVGKDPNAKPVVASPEPAKPTEVTRTTSEASKPEPTRADAPKPEAPPEPFFGAPTPSSTATPTPSPPTAAPTPATGGDEPKRWGGNGAPPYRDAANVPRGPGGPVFMGKGSPCTNKLDHCLRPGVWFAADNVVAGKLFRGTPVFEYEGKWWTWRGQLAEQKHLFRTKVVDKLAGLEVGKPIVFFVEDNGRKWLDNEHDMLTSSRWSVGVIESISATAIRIHGWGDVATESLRLIVEERKQ